MADYAKPLPTIERWNAPYWQAAKRRELVAQHCRSCGYVHLPPGPVCTNCLSDDQEWISLSGRGTINSYGVYHQQWHPAFEHDIPYNVALIELAEGPLIISQVIGCGNDALACGLPVEVSFDDVTPEISLPKFRLVRSEPL